MEKEDDKTRSKRLSDSSQEDNKILDHWLLTASLGSFGASFISLKELGVEQQWLLLLSWVFFGASALAILWTYLLLVEIKMLNSKILKLRYEGKLTDEYLGKANVFFLRPQSVTKLINWLNRSALFLFMAGIILAVVFAGINLYSRGEHEEKGSQYRHHQKRSFNGNR
jgi:hypothetical protein